ncbi:hypothetical protein KRM28CT15_12960 [Krasilnikovia sp. M28-CT-15]
MKAAVRFSVFAMVSPLSWVQDDAGPPPQANDDGSGMVSCRLSELCVGYSATPTTLSYPRASL